MERNETARGILEHARRAFNQRGVAAVGVRDLARELELSPGNLSYYFPTKDALIAALLEEAHATNTATVNAEGPLDFFQLDRMLRAIMQRDAENQWFLRDSIGLLLSVPALRAEHKRWQRAREERVDGIMSRLFEARLLDAERTDRELMRLQVITQVFFWVPSALLAAPDRDPAERLELHAHAALSLFSSSATPAGRRQLEQLLGARSKKR